MTTIRNGALHYKYEDEERRVLAIDGGRPGGAHVTADFRDPVYVLSEHVAEVCRQLADKAGAEIVVLDKFNMPEDATSSVIKAGDATYQVTGDASGVKLTSPVATTYRMTPAAARTLASALALHADRAEAAAVTAEVEELALVLRQATPGMAPSHDGDYGLAVCRGYAQVAIDAGWHKAGQL